MITTTHVALNGALTRWSRRSGGDLRWLRRLLPDRRARRALLLGGLAPDVGLLLLGAGAAVWFPLAEGWDLRRTSVHVFDELFFTDPVWIAAHNVLHAPLVVAALGIGAHLLRDRRPTARAVRAFAVGCALHTALDIPVHVGDGPLLLFPFEWTTRFHSPVSYYDPAYHGDVVAPVDLGLTVLLGGWLLVTWWGARRGDVGR